MIGVTGANGYIGSSLVKELSYGGSVVAIGRPKTRPDFVTNVIWKSLDRNRPTRKLFEGCEAVIHCAGLAHVNSKIIRDDAFDIVNRQLSVDAARAASDAGVKRFIYLSTIGVHGNWSDEPIHAESALRLDTPYARSKWAAEQELNVLCSSLSMELCIVRPSMVYGYKSPGNFSRLLKLVDLGMPLPFRSMNARRSFTSVENLTSFLITCSKAELPQISTFVFGDGSNWSTSELVMNMAALRQRNVRLFTLPSFFLRLLAQLAGRKREYDSLAKPMLIDTQSSWSACNWTPPFTIHSCLARSVSVGG